MFSVVIIFILSISGVFSANECPKIVTQKAFDVNKVSTFVCDMSSLSLLCFCFECISSTLAFGMKHIEMKTYSKSATRVLMQHIQKMMMDQ